MSLDMAKITSSLEKSLQNFSLTGQDSPDNHLYLDLNSQISLSYLWKQCLDIKTGEVYYINNETGMRSKDDPRTTSDFDAGGDHDDDDKEQNDNSSYDDVEESTLDCSHVSYSIDHKMYQHDHHNMNKNRSRINNNKGESILVVAGCKSCLMYFMVVKQDSLCSKCGGELLHFGRSRK